MNEIHRAGARKVIRLIVDLKFFFISIDLWISQLSNIAQKRWQIKFSFFPTLKTVFFVPKGVIPFMIVHSHKFDAYLHSSENYDNIQQPFVQSTNLSRTSVCKSLTFNLV